MALCLSWYFVFFCFNFGFFDFRTSVGGVKPKTFLWILLKQKQRSSYFSLDVSPWRAWCAAFYVDSREKMDAHTFYYCQLAGGRRLGAKRSPNKKHFYFRASARQRHSFHGCLKQLFFHVWTAHEVLRESPPFKRESLQKSRTCT